MRPHDPGDRGRGLEYGCWWVEWGGTLDTIRDNERIRDELLSILLGVWDHIKNGGDHGADHWALQWIGFVPGKRESRRFVGQYTLHERDILTSAAFEDAIAYGGWPIDLHPPQGIDAPDQPPCRQHEVPHLYDIPLRACVSAHLDNLMFAGRNLSATHVAFASTRVMATCAAVGQGVGTAAAHAARHRIPPARLSADPAAIDAIQQQLLRDDAYLIGRLEHDPHNLARGATVTASSFQVGGEPHNVLTGQTRSVHGRLGVPAPRANPGTHRWMSDPDQPLPQWIELSWPRPIQARRVQIIFDTGLHRVLTLSHADSYTDTMCWGRPQPETVADYDLLIHHRGACETLLQVRGNHQRRRVHELPAEHLGALRLLVRKTHGLPHARICEIRVET